MEKIKVLIADDVNELVETLKIILQKDEKIEVIGIANDGQDEYDKIIKLQPDLVFTDNQMPKMTGIEVIEKINNEPIITKKPDFILVTGDRDYNIYKKAYELNIHMVINKTYSEDKILNTITEYVESKKVIEEKVDIKEKGFISKLISKIKRKKEV